MSDRESLSALEPGLPPPFRPDADRFARVVRAIEGEIIPRLLMSTIATSRTANKPPADFPRHDDVADFARLLLSEDPWLAGAFIQEIRRKSVPLDRICLELLAPAAREIRELWEQRECDLDHFLTGIKRLLYLLQFITESVADMCSDAGRQDTL